MRHDTSFIWMHPAIVQPQDGPPLAGSSPGATQAPGSATPGAAPGASPAADSNYLFVMIFGLVAVMIFFSFFSGRREKKRRAQMLGGMKKHDKVRTIGGVLGSVVEVKPETVVLKVDESSNTRMTFARDAIQQIIDVDDRAVDTTESEDNQPSA